MIRDAINIFMISLFSLFFIAIFIYFGMGSYRVDSTESSLTEALKSSVVANADYSARIDNGEYLIDKDGFESDFKSRFEHLRNIDRMGSNIKYKFDYLDDSNGGVKAVKVKVNVNGVDYKSNVIVSSTGLLSTIP